MKNYKEIHIWEFPPTVTTIQLNKKFRLNLFNQLLSKVDSQQKLVNLLNKSSFKYGVKRKHSRRNLYCWIKGKKIERGTKKSVNIPLWLLIEASKILSKSNRNNNETMREIEKHVKYYSGWGKSKCIDEPKLPLYLTPEMVSIIFHFLGDGHIGKKGVCSSYRQMNVQGLNNFLTKLSNVFGNFEYNKKEFENGRLNVPKIITEFYTYYFKLPDTDTFKGRLPSNIKSLDRDFLIAGLASFIIDEGHVGEVITIYSKNRILLNDIREIAIKCGYICHQIREKFAYGKFDLYRFSISSKSYKQFHSDLKSLTYNFPTCNLAQKQKRLIKQIQ